MDWRLGKWGTVAVVAALIALGLVLALRWAIANHGPALLDWTDRQFGGNHGYRIALADGRYGADPQHRITVIAPETPATQPWPVVVFIHGGGWRSGDPRDYRFVGRQLARRGFVVVSAGYRLGPAGRYPAMLEDGAAALGWVQANVARFGGDPGGVCLIGHSAGAYNAAMLGLERQWLGRQALPEGFVRGVIGLAGPYDFYPFTSDSARNAFGHVEQPALTQPISYVRGDAPPMLLITGDADETVKPRNTAALAKALAALGHQPTVVVLPGMGHNDPVKLLAAPFNRDTRVIEPVLDFLEAHCRASAPVQAANR
ncbi:alpha/beta hydrolase [Novosphingobium sp.]|uniref:alpha/beta hydrolase n=1 Tax=Novosphingobium sp. TaxID=1874826 RepID=UPI00286B5AEB|nr:alpha/beta hydrolase [Novosphingobium sp.]